MGGCERTPCTPPGYGPGKLLKQAPSTNHLNSKFNRQIAEAVSKLRIPIKSNLISRYLGDKVGSVALEIDRMVNSCYSSCAHGQSLLCLQLHLDEAISLAYWSKPLISAIRAIPEVARSRSGPCLCVYNYNRDVGIHDTVFYPLFSRC